MTHPSFAQPTNPPPPSNPRPAGYGAAALRADRFGQKRLHLQTFFVLRVLHVAAGEDQSQVGALRAQPVGRFQATEIWHHDVDQHQRPLVRMAGQTNGSRRFLLTQGEYLTGRTLNLSI